MSSTYCRTPSIRKQNAILFEAFDEARKEARSALLDMGATELFSYVVAPHGNTRTRPARLSDMLRQVGDVPLPAAVKLAIDLRNKIALLNEGFIQKMIIKLNMSSKLHNKRDYHQIGMESLFAAVEGFEPKKGFQFSTYAGFVVRKALQVGQKAYDEAHDYESARDAIASDKTYTKTGVFPDFTKAQIKAMYFKVSIDEESYDSQPSKQPSKNNTMHNVLVAPVPGGPRKAALEDGVASAMSKLSHVERSCVEMCLIDDETIYFAAARLSISMSEVTAHIATAKSKMASQLEVYL